MTKSVLLMMLSFVVFSCENTTKKAIPQELPSSSEIIEKEPDKPEMTRIWEPKPARVIPGNGIIQPSDAIVLFDGSNLDEWVSKNDGSAAKWQLNSDGSMTVIPGTGDIQSKKEFGSVQLHIEWKSPSEIIGDGQDRGNSGIYFQKRYEIQILDNNDNETYVNGQAGAIYKQSIPLVNAAVATGEWNTYDIIFHAPKFDADGIKTASGTFTVLHNGILIQDHVEIKGSTEDVGWPKNIAHGDAAIVLQDHSCKVSYRNIWLRNL
jgi:hypothetical protein